MLRKYPQGQCVRGGKTCWNNGRKKDLGAHSAVPPAPTGGNRGRFFPDPVKSEIRIGARVKTNDRTGVEMEALVAVTTAALTIYDMCKAIDRGMTIREARLTFKSGGKSGVFERA